MFRKKSAHMQPDAFMERMAGVRSSLEAALSQMEQMSTPRRRGPFGVRDPFGRRSYFAEVASNLGSLSNSMAGMSLDSVRPSAKKSRAPELSGVLVAVAVAFAAAGAALLWLGSPNKAIESASGAMKRFTGSDEMAAQTYVTSSMP